MSGCDLSQVARIYAVLSNVSKSRSVTKCFAAVLAECPLAKRRSLICSMDGVDIIAECLLSFSLLSCKDPRGVGGRMRLICFTFDVEVHSACVFAEAAGELQTINFCMYSLLQCQQLN